MQLFVQNCLDPSRATEIFSVPKRRIFAFPKIVRHRNKSGLQYAHKRSDKHQARAPPLFSFNFLTVSGSLSLSLCVSISHTWRHIISQNNQYDSLLLVFEKLNLKKKFQALLWFDSKLTTAQAATKMCRWNDTADRAASVSAYVSLISTVQTLE